MKSRGMKHSNQVREFVISEDGLKLVEVYLGPEGVLIGSARQSHELMERTGAALHDHAVNRKDREVLRKKHVLESRISTLQAEFESAEEELNKVYQEEAVKKQIAEKTRMEMTRLRRGDGKPNTTKNDDN